jgi:hypothetical protein
MTDTNTAIILAKSLATTAIQGATTALLYGKPVQEAVENALLPMALEMEASITTKMTAQQFTAGRTLSEALAVVLAQYPLAEAQNTIAGLSASYDKTAEMIAEQTKSLMRQNRAVVLEEVLNGADCVSTEQAVIALMDSGRNINAVVVEVCNQTSIWEHLEAKDAVEAFGSDDLWAEFASFQQESCATSWLENIGTEEAVSALESAGVDTRAICVNYLANDCANGDVTDILDEAGKSEVVELDKERVMEWLGENL